MLALQWVGWNLMFCCGCSPREAMRIDATNEEKQPQSNQTASRTSTSRRTSKYPRALSEYRLFQGELHNLTPAHNVMEYDVNTPLFSDYSLKQRVICLPEGMHAQYDGVGVFQFPVGTVIAKTFYYPRVLSDLTEGRHLIETRILVHNPEGWIGLPYVWNAEQTDAELSITGAFIDVNWIHGDGSRRTNVHLVPNLNDCKRCHQNESMAPIGTTARNLNREFNYHQEEKNQLEHWSQIGFLHGSPELSVAPKLPVWDDPHSGSVDKRARAWLEVNCAHCHNPHGPARNSGLHLHADVSDCYQLGVFKTPVAAGKGTGGRLYGIVPGKPDESIMLYRLETTHPGSMMPEFGRSLVHEESVALIRQWIVEMNNDTQKSVN